MSDSITWSDRALARALGTDEPSTIATVKAYLEMPNAELALSYTEPSVYDDPNDPELEVVDTAEVVDAILARHGHLRRP